MVSAIGVSGTAITVTWSNVTSEAGYVLQRCTGASCTDFASIQTLPINTTVFTDTDLSVGTTYRYRVFAFNEAGFLDYSASVPGTPLPPPLPPTSIAAATASDTRADVTWSHAGGTTGFSIYRCSGAGCTPSTQVASVDGNARSYANTGLSPLTAYRYAITALNSGGTSLLSSVAGTSTWSQYFSCTAGTVGTNRLEGFNLNIVSTDCPLGSDRARAFNVSTTAPRFAAVATSSVGADITVLNVNTGASRFLQTTPPGWPVGFAAVTATSSIVSTDRFALSAPSGTTYQIATARCGFTPRIDGTAQTWTVPSASECASSSSGMYGLFGLDASWSTLLPDIRIRVTTTATTNFTVCLLKWGFSSTTTQQCASSASVLSAVEFTQNLDDWGSVPGLYAVRIYQATGFAQWGSFSLTITKE